MDDVLRFSAKCHNCGRDATQTYDKAKLRKQLSESMHIELYRIGCDATQNLDAEARMKVGVKLASLS